MVARGKLRVRVISEDLIIRLVYILNIFNRTRLRAKCVFIIFKIFFSPARNDYYVAIIFHTEFYIRIDVHPVSEKLRQRCDEKNGKNPINISSFFRR